MLVSVLVNNFNNEKYIYECLNSVLCQTYPELELIFVDDGSTDGSVEIAKGLSDDRLTIIVKENGGQLSAMNKGVDSAKGEIIFFLDGDDSYECNYVETAINYFRANIDCDFLSVGHMYVGNESGKSTSRKSGNLGYSCFSAIYKREWVGGVTSTLSIKASFLKRYFPLIALEVDWLTRADDCLVWGASVFGAQKHHLDLPLVNYRIHALNRFHRRSFSQSYALKRERAVIRLLSTFIKESQIRDSYLLIYYEFVSRSPNLSTLKKYIAIVLLTKLSFVNKIKLILIMMLYLCKKIFSRRSLFQYDRS